MLLRIQKMVIEVQFIWNPANVGVKGNEQADKLAKKALKEDDSKVIKVAMVENTCQNELDTDNKGIHYHNIQKSVNFKQFSRKYRNRKSSLQD